MVRQKILNFFTFVGVLAFTLTGTCVQAAAEFVVASKPIFAHPHDIELHPTGKWLFVSDTNHDNVKVLLADSLELVSVIGDGELDGPHDVHFDKDGRLLVADSGNDRVVIYRLDGLQASLETVLDQEMRSPEGVTSSPEGIIFVASTGNNKILKFFQNKLSKEVGQRGDGKLEFVRPHDIELGADGNLYIGDPGNSRIQVLDQNLAFHAFIISNNEPYKEPKYLALDKQNLLYIADQQNNMLRIYSADRKQIDSIAEAGGKSLNYIEGVEVVGAKLWISDTYNDRIVLFKWKR